MNGILWAYLRDTMPSTPSVEATPLQPPSMASLTMFSGIEVIGVRREAGAGGMLDPLIDRQDRDVAGAAEPAGVEQKSAGCAARWAAVGVNPHAIDEIGPGNIKSFPRYLGLMLQKRFGFGAQQLFDLTKIHGILPE